MKRLMIALLLVVPGAALAFDVTPATPRIGVLLQAGERIHEDALVSDSVLEYLREELRDRGLDAFDAGLTYGEAVDEGYADADYLIEVVAAADGDEYGGVGVGGPHGGVELSVSVARVLAEVRVYDGRTFELLSSVDLRKRSTAVLPTAVAVGGRRSWLSIAAPIAQWIQYRHVARSAAREAASRITATIAEK
jgi:hypothetical protein